MSRYVEQETVPRRARGVDYGAAGRVLVRSLMGVTLVWRSGYKYWSSIAVWKYQLATLQICGLPMLGLSCEDIHEGGRMMAAVKAAAKDIDDVFGGGIAEQIKANKTLVV